MLLLALIPSVSQAETSSKTADGFDLPLSPPDGIGFYKSRGFRAGGHLGEDWVTDGGSAKGFRHPVQSIGNGLVVLARDIRADWGNVVVIRHAWVENKQLHFADSLYAHLDGIKVHEGEQIKRGQVVGTVGTNHGMYPPHLHFEVHKDLSIGVNHSGGTRDLRSYWVPTEFVLAHRHLHGGNRNVPTPAAHFLLPTASNPWSFHRFFFHSQKKSHSKNNHVTHCKHSQSTSHSSHPSKKKKSKHHEDS